MLRLLSATVQCCCLVADVSYLILISGLNGFHSFTADKVSANVSPTTKKKGLTFSLTLLCGAFELVLGHCFGFRARLLHGSLSPLSSARYLPTVRARYLLFSGGSGDQNRGKN